MEKQEKQRNLRPASVNKQYVPHPPPTLKEPIIKEQPCELVSINSDVDLIERQGQQYAGRHYIIDFWGMDDLKDPDKIDRALRQAATAANATLLHMHLHQFSGEGGITGVALLAESHISIHTWPEYNYAAFDVFMCGHSQPEKAVEVLIQTFGPDRHDINELLRGKVSAPTQQPD